MDEFSQYTDEEIDARIAENNARLSELDAAGGNDAGQDLDSLSDAELDARLAANNARLAELDGGGQDAADAPQGDDYGFTDRQRDQIAAEGGRKAYTGQEYVEGLAPLTRAMRQGRERDEDKELGAWLSDGDDNTLRVALGKHGAARDPSLEGYKAKETGGFWEGVGDDLSRNLAQLPLGAGWLFRKAREADNPQKYATDHLMQSAFLSGFSRADIEQAKEVSQGDPAKMYDFFAERAEKKLKGFAAEKQGAQERLAAHADEEGTLSKVAGGALGMIPMMEEFALGGAAGKAITGATKLGAVARALPNTWRGRVVGGLIHGLGTTTTMAPEMARRRYGELTADEYSQDENGNLVKREGDTAERALPKAILGGVGEAAIFSMPIGEAAFGWTTPMVTKALRTKVGNTVANMYTNYVKYGQMTGLRGQPQMLALMDLNAFKDEVLGFGKKDSDYKGFDAEWRKFTEGEDLPDGTHVPGTLSLQGQMDMFVSTLGVIAMQGGAALAKARVAMGRDRQSTDAALKTYYHVPQEQLDKMTPEHKAMWRKLIMQRSRGGGGGGFALTQANLENFCRRMDRRFGEAAGSTYEKMGKYALEFDNSYGWENKGDLDGIGSNFSLPSRAVRDADGKLVGYDVPWEDAPVTLPDGTETQGQAFTDPNTGISVMRYIQTDKGAGDNGYVYLIRDVEGRRATRFGFKDTLDAANIISRRQQKNKADSGGKLDALRRTYAELMPGESPLVVNTAEQAAEIKGAPLEPGEIAFTGGDGRQYYVLDRFQTPEQMRKVVLHEAGRHRGIDLALPNPADKMGFLAGLAKSGDPVVQDQVRRIAEARMARGEIGSAEELFKRDKDGNYLHANALEEVWAHLFDHEGVPDAPGWWDAHMNAIRGNLRKVFHGLSYSRAEAEEMYRGAMEKLREQTGGEIEYVPDEPPTPPAPEPPSGKEAERLQSGVNAERAEGRASDFAAAEANLGEEIGAKHEAADQKRKARETTARRQQEIAAQKAQGEAYDEQERQRIERERQEERDAQDEAEIQRLIDAEERETDMAKRDEYQRRRREITERRARERAEAKERADAEAVAAAQEREKQAQEREEQRRAGYESADEQARLDRRNAVKQAIREDDARQAEEYDRAEAERKAREAAEESAPLPEITVVDVEARGRGRTAPQNDVVRVNYGAENGREGHPIVARRVTNGNGTVIGWDVNAVANDGTETLIASTTKPKKDGEAAIRAVRRQIHEHFGLPYGKAQKEAMEAERRRVEESETRKEIKDEARDGADEEPAKSEQERRNELPPEGEDPRPADEGSAEAQGGEPIVVHHANEGREGDGVEAANDILAGMFEDATTETPVEAPVAAPREEGAITPPRAAEGAEGGKSASGGDSSGFDFAAFDRINANRDPSTQFFDVNEELSPERRDENWRLVQGIAAMYDQKRIRGFYDFAKYMQRVNPAWYAEQKDGLRRLWNYAAETTGLFDRVGDYEARDAIRSVDEGRNVRDISAINALEAALQDIDVEMYPAAQLDRSDARVPNTKLAADPKSGIVPGNELKGRPRGLLSKPILGVEFEDGTVSVGTGRHRAELYARYGMDIPMRRVREADGWVTKKPDGSYDFTKIRLLDALDNIQDSKGTIEDYVAFFGDVKIPRVVAESEGFLGSKEARLAYALANDAHPDIRAAVNFEGGKVEGTVKPEQAAAIAEIAPIGAAPENDGLQHHLLKAALKDHTLDKRDLQIKASEALQMLRAKRNRDGFEQMGFEFLGDEDVQNAAETAEDYRKAKAAEYSRLAKSLREVQRSKEGDLVKKKITRDDLRELGINERKIAAGGKEKQEELQRAIDKATMEKMRWESINLDPDLRAQMDKDLGITPKEPPRPTNNETRTTADVESSMERIAKNVDAVPDDTDTRGFSYAIVKDGKVWSSGSNPTMTPPSKQMSIGEWRKLAKSVGGELYIAPTHIQDIETSPGEKRILGMTWGELVRRQHGDPNWQEPRGDRKLPKNAIRIPVSAEPPKEQTGGETVPFVRPASALEKELTDTFTEGRRYVNSVDGRLVEQRMIDPLIVLNGNKRDSDWVRGNLLEGKTWDEVVNMPTTQKYIQMYKDGTLAPPAMIVRMDNGKLASINRRRVVAAIEAGIKKIPANIETGERIEQDVLERLRNDRSTESVPVSLFPKTFSLESVTADQLKKEAAAQAQREAIRKGLEAPLKGDGQVDVQPEMDFGQTGQQDLFSPVAENVGERNWDAPISDLGSARAFLDSIGYPNLGLGGLSKVMTDKNGRKFIKYRANGVIAPNIYLGETTPREIAEQLLLYGNENELNLPDRIADKFKKEQADARSARAELDDQEIASIKDWLKSENIPFSNVLDSERGYRIAYTDRRSESGWPMDYIDVEDLSDAKERIDEIRNLVRKAETPAQSPAKIDFKRGDHVFLKGAAENQSITFLKANADGTADVQVKTPGANRYMPGKVETRSVPLGDISSTGMKDVLTEAERKRLAEGMASQRFFNAAEEVTPERNKDYADWLGKYRMADTPDHRREWARKNPDKARRNLRFMDADEERRDFEARQYTPAKYKVPGAVKSRTLLEEPPALRATEPPDNDYKLHIPDSIIRNGDLQEHQAEFVGYAGKSHETVRPDGTRLGMMGGYGTGAGKSRMIAGIILDNRNQGRKRALWITTQSGLIDDVRSESRPFGMDGMVSDIFGGKGVSVPKDGIGFGTYHGLRQDGVAEKIAQQLGKDFDGVIAFDEIHRAKTEGGRTQDAVVKLQELLPKARVVYMSATGATDVGNLGYAQRLGLWGEGTAFKDFEDFKKKVEGKGVSAMEMVAQTLKRRGQYLSANLSKEGVEFDHVAVPTTDAQKRTYAEYNGALKDVYKGVYDALEALGRLDYTVPPSSLHGMQQRLHYSMVTALKLPVLIERAKQELAKGNVPVFSLVNTNEAGSTREVAKALEEGRRLGMDEVNFGPKQILLDFLTKEGDKTYNKQEGAYRDYQFPTMKPVKDQSGEVVGFERDPIADGIRRRLVREVEALPDDFGNPINMIIDAFGKDNVANLTGLNKGGMAEDYKAFQDGGKKVLVFSGVANTGYTFSSDRKYKNQARRVLFPLQLGYRADELEQTLGRVHRNNQANAPIYIASTTDLPGERRFYSSVERRRGQMKALTTGDRAATGNGITSEGDNFETKYAQDAVDGIIAALHRMGKLDEIAREMNFIKRTQRADGSVVEVNGMLKRDKSGAILPNVPAKRFLNRLLMLDPKRQDAMFSAFKNLLDQNIRWAKDDGEYDIGLQDIGSTRNDAVRSVKLADDMEVGHVNSWFKTDKVPFDDFARDHAAEFLTYVRNKRTGETFAVRADGKMGRKQEPAAMRYAVDGTKKRMRASIFDTEKPNSAYERLDTARAKELWDAEYGVIPDERADDGFYAHGDLLRHWTDVLGSKPPRTFRVKAGDAPEYIGAKIDADEIPAIFGRFGKAEEARDMVIDGKVREVLNNRTVDLVNGWTLKQVPRDGAKAVMVRGVEPGQLDAVAKELGGEVSKKRIFMKPDAAKLRKIIEEHPANLYRDDEKIGDTGNLRFFNVGEEGAERLGIGKKDEALRLEGAGAGREEIWRKTGWWRGRDGKWRVEIPDAKLPTWKIEWLENDSRVNPGNDYPVSVLASAKELFAAYPELKDVKISVRRLPTGTYAESDVQGRRIVLNDLLLRGMPHSVESTLNHELQHFIQGIEGFAKGGNAFKMGHEEYLRQAGEVESRNIQKRLAMSPEERAATPPWETEDVPESEQHVRFFDTREEADRDRDAAYRDWLKRYGMDDTEKHRAEWERKHPAQEKQTALSGDTSLNQNPSGNRYAQAHGLFKPGTRNIDIGAGKFDKATQFLREQGVENIPYDPVNRDAETNRRAAESVRENPADTATVHNVLNVIDNDAVMEGIVNQAARAIKKDGTAIFTIYEGDRSGNGRVTTKGYQRNAKASAYVPVLEKYFGEVKTHGNVITARQPKDVGSAFWAEDSSFDRGLRFFNIDEEAGRRVHAKDYDEALRMEGAGAGRREIWEKTGWWKGKDGKWRYEIPGISAADTQSMLDAVFTSGKFRDKNKANVYTFTLNDLEKELKDKGESLPTSVKTLLKAYPKLGKESIEVDRAAEQPKDGTLGYATKGTIHLYERGTTAETLNHELQHRIQAASGMAGGTNTDGKSFDRYTHEHGEWEARQAATRADMTAEQRDKTAPWETADRHGVAEDATLIDDANRARIRPDGEPPEPEPAAPAMDRKTGIGEKAKTELMDRYDPIKKMEIETGRRGKKDLFVEKSPYNAMRQLHGHNEAARQCYEKIWKRPFEEMLRKSGVGLDDVGMYMIAMNAKDRNRKVLNRTGALDGAGISDADADKMIADMRRNFGADKMRKIEEMADFLWKMQDEGMERRVESGRVSRETADLWEQEEPHHVPMRDDLSDEDGDYNRSTRRWTRNDFHEAGGRYTLPDNPVEFMFKEYQDAMYGSNINDARRALADFVRSTPGVGKIRRGVRRGKAWSFTHGQIEDFPDPNYREQSVRGGAGRPNLVSFKEGGDLYMIELNGKQGERVAEAVIGRGVRRVEDFLPTLAKINRAYASTATEYSLTFLGRNAIADMIEASLNTMADKGLIRGSASAVKNIVNAFRMMGTIKAYVNKGKFEGAFADTMRRYVESGALIGGMGNEGITEMKRDLGKVASGKYGVMDVVKFVGRTISNINKRGELATRLAVFKDYIDGGASDGEASMRSREYSTDFNKYGNQRWMNTTWMFSGSVIGGAVRQTASLVQGKAGKQLATALFAYGVAEALAEHFFNSDDDEKGGKSGQPSGATMTEYQRANSLYFRMGDKYIRAPFHAGPFSVLKYAGNIVARAAMGDISWSEAGKHMAGEGVDNIMHFTGTGDFNHETIAQSLAPTLLVPFLQLKANEDFAGRPIRKQMFSETKPYSENGRKGTGDIWKAVARGANALGGGNERRRGVEWLDNSPEAYRHVVADSLLKNLGRDVATVFDFVTDMCEGKSVFETDKTHRLFMRDYYRDVPDNTQNFYEAEKAYKADRADGTIKQGSRRDEAVKKLLRDITTLRHWEDGEEKVGSRWVKKRNPSEATKEKHKKMRLRYQQRVIELMRRKK